MADTVAEQPASKAYRTWVIGLSLASLLMLGVGVWLATFTAGVARPWMGLGLMMSMGLAAVVGASKTSSA